MRITTPPNILSFQRDANIMAQHVFFLSVCAFFLLCVHSSVNVRLLLFSKIVRISVCGWMWCSNVIAAGPPGTPIWIPLSLCHMTNSDHTTRLFICIHFNECEMKNIFECSVVQHSVLKSWSHSVRSGPASATRCGLLFYGWIKSFHILNYNSSCMKAKPLWSE